MCPICDAYEVIDKRVAVIGPADQAAKKAVFLRTYSSEVTLLVTEPISDLDPVARELLNGADVTVEECLPDSVSAEGYRASASLSDGRTLSFDTINPVMCCTMRSTLAIDLGAAFDEAGNLVVDSHQRTGIAGLYAAGDIVDDNQPDRGGLWACGDRRRRTSTTILRRSTKNAARLHAEDRCGGRDVVFGSPAGEPLIRCAIIRHALHDLVNGSAANMRTKGKLPWQKKRRWKISSTIH